MKLLSATVLISFFTAEGINAFTLSSPPIRRFGTPLTASAADYEKSGMVRITDVEAELIARKLREEIIDFPMIPNYLEKTLVEQIIKAIIDVGPTVMPEDVFKRIIAGEKGIDGLNESIIREINERIDIPIISKGAQNALVEQICALLFGPTSFKKMKRQMLSRASQDLLNEDSRADLAKQLNEMFDIPFVSEEREQIAADKLVNLVYGIFDKVMPPEVQKMLETSSPEELREVRENMIHRINEKIDVPFVSEDKEEECIRFIIDFWLGYWGLAEGTKKPDEVLIDTEHKLRETEIELQYLLDITKEQISDLENRRDSLRKKYTEMAASVCPPPTDVDDVYVLKDADAVGKRIREIVAEEAERAIAKRGHFAIAIPGGSILKMLAGDIPNKEKWTSKCTLVYVNHKCVSMDDADLSTHAKATKLFLNDWKGVNVVVLGGSGDAEKEAQAYEDQLKALGNDILPVDSEDGLPLFDLSLIGVGDDGHIGSLYPGREEVMSGSYGPWVLPVDMKNPGSITLSLPVMKGQKTVVAACGVSDKYPQGKSDGMRRAIAADDESLVTFPAVGLRDCATWVLDEMAASKLGHAYFSEPATKALPEEDKKFFFANP